MKCLQAGIALSDPICNGPEVSLSRQNFPYFSSAFFLLPFRVFSTYLQNFLTSFHHFFLLSFTILLTSLHHFFYFLSPFFFFFFSSLLDFLLPFTFLKLFYFSSAFLYFQESYKTVARKRSSQNFPKINILSVCLFSEKFSCFVFLYSSFWYSLFCLITHLLKNKLENLHNPVILEAWREFPDSWKTMITLWLIKDFNDEDAKCTENK